MPAKVTCAANFAFTEKGKLEGKNLAETHVAARIVRFVREVAARRVARRSVPTDVIWPIPYPIPNTKPT